MAEIERSQELYKLLRTAMNNYRLAMYAASRSARASHGH
jgi:hypothetical protein